MIKGSFQSSDLSAKHFACGSTSTYLKKAVSATV